MKFLKSHPKKLLWCKMRQFGFTLFFFFLDRIASDKISLNRVYLGLMNFLWFCCLKGYSEFFLLFSLKKCMNFCFVMFLRSFFPSDSFMEHPLFLFLFLFYLVLLQMGSSFQNQKQIGKAKMKEPVAGLDRTAPIHQCHGFSEKQCLRTHLPECAYIFLFFFRKIGCRSFKVRKEIVSHCPHLPYIQLKTIVFRK